MPWIAVLQADRVDFRKLLPSCSPPSGYVYSIMSPGSHLIHKVPLMAKFPHYKITKAYWEKTYNSYSSSWSLKCYLFNYAWRSNYSSCYTVKSEHWQPENYFCKMFHINQEGSVINGWKIFLLHSTTSNNLNLLNLMLQKNIMNKMILLSI